MEFNFVYFDPGSSYYNIARYDIERLPNCIIRSRDLPAGGKLKKVLFQLHTSLTLNKRIVLPLQSLWNRSYIGDLNFPDNSKPICFVFTGGFMGLLSYQMKTVKYLRKTYPGCKLVLLIRDLLKVTKHVNQYFDLDEAKRTYDEIYTINTNEAEKYGLKAIHSYCSYYPVETSPQDKKSDVVFIGVVKDRLDTIKRAYEKFTKAGLVCDFLLVSRQPIEGEFLPEGLVIQQAGIPYLEMLKRTVNSSCVLEITQKDADGLTSRCLEALCYNKKLISDNFRLKDTKYYDSDYMYLYQDIDEVPVDFIKKQIDVDYHYDGEFSPIRTLEIFERDLLQKEKEGEDYDR